MPVGFRVIEFTKGDKLAFALDEILGEVLSFRSWDFKKKTPKSRIKSQKLAMLL